MRPPWEAKRERLTKHEEESDPSYGSPPLGRPIDDYLRHGIINLDKTSGPTSHEVVAWVKRVLRVDHAGHGGTLDPRVTGVLPVALGDATKVLGTLLHTGKEYICVMRLHGEVAQDRIRAILAEFVGAIYQKPPLRSSVKRVVRRRWIYYLDALEYSGRRVLFRVGCQAGTYIRKLVYDMGEALGTGAHMEELRRTRVGTFTEDVGLTSLYDLTAAHDAWTATGDEASLRRVVQPIENALRILPKIYIRDSAVDAICHGARIAVPGIAQLETGIAVNDTVGLLTLKGELVALARAAMPTEMMMQQRHGIAATTLRVIMKPDTYPKLWKRHDDGHREA
jgi:H/ACA ribonucleoprotein complex subunit 4